MLLLAAVGGVTLAQAPGEAPPNAAPAALEKAAPAQEQPTSSMGTFYINPLWLALVMVAVTLWLYLTSWVSDDAKGLGLDFPKYGVLMLGAGGVGLLFTLLVHAGFAFLLVFLVLVVFTFYIVVRNRVAPERHKFLGVDHRLALFGKIPVLKKLATLTPRMRRSRPSVSLTSQDGRLLDDVAAQQPSLSEAADVLMDAIMRAGAARARKVRFQPAGEQYIAQYLLDGVLHNVEAFTEELGGRVLACASQLVGLSRDGRVRQGSGDIYVELPGLGQVTIGAQVSSAEGKPVLLLSLPDWTDDLHRSGLEALGMHEAIIKRIKAALDQTTGALLICGPPGSGKTTTLYAVAGALDVFTTDLAILHKGPTHEVEHARYWSFGDDRPFAQVFQEVLREGPHAIMLGDVEGPEQARSGLEFGADEGLLLAGLRATDAPEALLHLKKLAGTADLIGRGVTCVIVQRLLRKICTACREQVEPNPALLRKLNIDPNSPGVWYKPVGCESCLNSGYHGRTGIFGMLILTEPVKEALQKAEVAVANISQGAGKAAFRTMYQDGISKVTAGITTLDEVRRVLKGR